MLLDHQSVRQPQPVRLQLARAKTAYSSWCKLSDGKWIADLLEASEPIFSGTACVLHHLYMKIAGGSVEDTWELIS